MSLTSLDSSLVCATSLSVPEKYYSEVRVSDDFSFQLGSSSYMLLCVTAAFAVVAFELYLDYRQYKQCGKSELPKLFIDGYNLFKEI